MEISSRYQLLIDRYVILAALGGKMENRTNFLRSEFIRIAVIAVMFAIVIMGKIKVSGILLDILISCNIFLALLFFLYTVFVRKTKYFTFYIYALLFLVIYGLTISIAAPGHILNMKENFNSQYMNIISAALESISIEGLVFLFIGFIYIVIFHEALVSKSTIGLIETTEDFKKLHYKDDFLYFMDIVRGLITITLIVGIFINVVTVVSLVLLQDTLNQETVKNAIKTFTPLIIGNGIVLVIPAFLLSHSIRQIVIRYVWDEECLRSAIKS